MEIQKFLESVEEFADIQIDDEQEIVENQNSNPFQKTMVGKKIIDLKTNFIPKGLVPLERLFDYNDVFLNPESKVDGESTIEYNIGTEDQPRLVKVSKFLSLETITKYIKLLKEFADIFAWSYSELKTYDMRIMEHKIPLQIDKNHATQKIRHINPMLLPVIEKEIRKLWEENYRSEN